MNEQGYSEDYFGDILTNTVTSFKSNDSKDYDGFFSQWASFTTAETTTDQNTNVDMEKILEMRKLQAIMRNFSLIGNSLQILTSSLTFVVFYKKSGVRTVNNMYSFHVFLSIFGNGAAGICHRLPLGLGDNINIMSNTACIVILGLARFFYTVTMMFVAATALNKFFAICFPGKRYLRGKFV